MKRTNYLKAAGIAVPAIVFACGIGHAQTTASAGAQSADTSGQLQDIIVTAQRKSERLQDVPIAVNVISGEVLNEKGITNTMDLPALVPGLAFTSTGPAGTVYLRGIGSNAGNPNDEPSVATYVDGVYIGASFANMLNLANVDHVEVLKGPQGTLFGRNATGGVIQVITRDPQQTPEMEVTGGYGNFNTGYGSLYATSGITDGLAFDVSVQGSDQAKGWGYNGIVNHETFESSNYAIRSKLLYTPNDQFRATLAADYEYVSNNMVDYRLPPGVIGIDGQPSPAGLYDTRSDAYNNVGTPFVTAKQFGASLNLKYEGGFADFVSITAFRHGTGTYYPDADATPLPVVEGSLPLYQKNYSQELQLLSPKGSKFDWTVGLYYYNNDAGYQNLVFSGLAFANPPFSGIGQFDENAIQHTESFAGYAQVTVPVLENTRITAGIRDTNERQTSETTLFGQPLPDQHLSFNRPTWRLAVDQTFTNDVHGYVSYNRGVKGGGFDLLTPGSTGFRPETVDAYEIGVKSNLLDRRLRLNSSVFDYEYHNIQVQVIPAGAGGGIIETTNAARARIRGIDADFEAVPADHVTLSGGFAYLDGKYIDFQNTVAYTASPLDPRPSYCSSPTPGSPCLIDASGNPTIHTPKFTGNLTAAYDIISSVGKFPLSVTASYNSGFAFSTDDRLRQPSYTLLNAAAGWGTFDGKYSVTLWGSNLANKYYLEQGVPSSLGDLTAPAAPRTYGVTLKAKFGG